jgi:hypothetical protein
MQTQHVAPDRRGPLVFGGILLALGLAAFALEAAGEEVGRLVGEAGWPFFVIVPGLLLLGAAFLVPKPRGLGFAVAGSIVTTVGLILLVQNATGLYETWAWVWALIPTAAGLGLFGYGLFADEPAARSVGTRLAAIGTVLLIVGAWFFNPILIGGQPPITLDGAWPVALVVAGAVILGWALLDRGTPSSER